MITVHVFHGTINHFSMVMVNISDGDRFRQAYLLLLMGNETALVIKYN